MFVKYCHESGEKNTIDKTWKVGKKEIYLNVCIVLTVSDITGSIIFLFFKYIIFTSLKKCTDEKCTSLYHAKGVCQPLRENTVEAVYQ